MKEYKWTKLQKEKIAVHEKVANFQYPFYFNIDQSLTHYKPTVFFPGEKLFALGARRQFVEVLAPGQARWLTVEECACLMNLDVEPFSKASQAQQYKAIGNSISIDMFDKLNLKIYPDDEFAELCGGVCAFSQWHGKKPNEYAEIGIIGDVISEYYGIENLKDITKIKKLKSNAIVLGSPCTSFSLAGRREGGEKGSGTASSLLWELPRILQENNHVDYFIFENVDAITHDNNEKVLTQFKQDLIDLGFELDESIIEAEKTTRRRYFIVGTKTTRRR